MSEIVNSPRRPRQPREETHFLDVVLNDFRFLLCSCDESNVSLFQLCGIWTWNGLSSDKQLLVFAVLSAPLLVSLSGSPVAQQHLNVRQYPWRGVTPLLQSRETASRRRCYTPAVPRLLLKCPWARGCRFTQPEWSGEKTALQLCLPFLHS